MTRVPVAILIALSLLCLLAWAPAWARDTPPSGQLRPSRSPEVYPFALGAYLYRVMDQQALRGELEDLTVDAGAGWTREEFHWAWIEPRRGVYDQDKLAQYDALVDAALAKGLKIIGIIAYGNSWSSGEQAPSRDSHYQDYADFVSFLVERYRDRISYWQVWNEPNGDRFWLPQPNPENYCQLLRHAYQAAKAVDPEVKIIGCSTAGIDLEFIMDVFQAGCSGYLDIMAVQPYPNPDPFERSSYPLLLAGLQQLISLWGSEVPIWFTETGYATCSGGTSCVDQDRQAQLLVRTYLSALASGVELVAWYDLRDDGLDPANKEYNFGLVSNQAAEPPLSPKPAYYAYQTMVSFLGSTTYQGSADLSWNQKVAWFRGQENHQSVLVAWVADKDTPASAQEVSIPITGQVHQVSDIFGDAHPYSLESSASGGQALVTTISGSPIYIVGELEPG